MTTQKRNRLRPEQLHQLQRWAKTARRTLRGVSHAQVAEVATKELGYHVTPGNVRGLRIDWQRGPGAPRVKPDLAAMIEQIRHDLARVARRVGVSLTSKEV